MSGREFCVPLETHHGALERLHQLLHRWQKLGDLRDPDKLERVHRPDTTQEAPRSRPDGVMVALPRIGLIERL
jgi:hypothetical protein